MKKLLLFCLFSFGILAGPGSGGGGHLTIQGRVLLNAYLLGLNQDKLQDLVIDLRKKDIELIIPNSMISDIRTTNEDIFVPSKNVLLNNSIKDIQLTNGNIINNF